MKFKNIYNQTKSDVESSMLSLWTPGRHRMRRAIKDLFAREPIMAEPLFQSMFPWETTTDDNWRNYLNNEVIRRLHIGRDAGGDYDPYQHQTDSWRALQEGNSLVVTSGTGSGKTECFMYPVISDLYEQNQIEDDGAVKAIFLYPLNALMQDQKHRLGKACEATGLRFAVYNGSLKGVSKPNCDYANAEVRSRQDVRSRSRNNQRPSLPHILLTNPSMLEYMMVRKDDQPIFDRSQGKLRWIIIDEAHTYTGSAAVELAYMIKRVMSVFGVSREDVRFVCTSATIGDPSQPEQLIEFIENIIGCYSERSPYHLVHIGGNRLVPILTAEEIRQELQARNIDNTSAEEVLSLRAEINRKPMSLGEIWQTLTSATFNISSALDLVDQLCDIRINGSYVLMLRGHFFMRSINGLYACVNHHCPNSTDYRDTGFEFLTSNRGDGYCPHCGAPLLEIVQCGGCKEFLLMCEESDTRQIRYCGSEQSNDDSVDNSNNDDDLTDGGQNNAGWEKKYFAFFGNGRNYAKPHPTYMESRLALEWDGNVLKSNSRCADRPWMELRNDQNLYCPTCSSGSGADGRKFKPFRLSTNWLNNTIAPALLKEGADANNVWGKYIAFTDSRQGTAIYAKRFNVESERAYARAHLVETLSTTNETGLTIRDVANCIYNEQMFEHIDYDVRNRSINRRGDGRYKRDVDAYKTSLIRSIIGRRPVVANSSENLGLISLSYPAINASNVPNRWVAAGFNETDWKNFLKIAVDYLIRQGNHLQCPTYTERAYLRDGDNSSPFDPNDWPRVRMDNNRVCIKQSRLALLLCAALGINDPETLGNGRNIVDNLLQDVWQFLTTKGNILTMVEPGDDYDYDTNNIGRYYIDFSLDSNVCRIKTNRELWICPVSNYLLDTTFRGYSPHIKGCLNANNIERFRCSNTPDITMPVFNPEISFEEWLANNNEVDIMVQSGVWNDRHKYAYQPKAEGYLTAEHSGQQNRDILSYYTNEFKAQPHRLNLLQCSTTMEMGVDIGDIDTVLMTNIPPTAANYLQRAGRAGRNGQSRSVAYSLCPNTSMGIQTFDNPMMFITSFNTVIPPLKSEIIIQRHVNSFFMHEFVSSQGVSTNNVEEWFIQGGISENFENFLTKIVNDNVIRDKFSRIFDNTPNYVSGIHQTQQRLGEIRNEYRAEYDALENEFNIAYDENDQRKMNAINIQLTVLEKQKLKEYLSEKQYLPNANFPTGIVEFNYIDREQYDSLLRKKEDIETLKGQIAQEQRPLIRKQLQHRKKQIESEIQDILEKTVAQREIKIALTEYAPDQEVVINEQNLKSEGIEWKNSYNARNPLKYLYYCRNCGRYEYSNNGNLTRCPSCQSPLANLLSPNQRQRFTLAIEPVRFRTDINHNNNIREGVVKQYYKCDTILTHVDWQNPTQGPLCELIGNGDGQGEIVLYNKGAGQGFKLCLDCGRMVLEDNNNNVWTHRPLTDRAQANNNCVAGNVYHNVVLSGAFPTSYVSIRFKETSNPTSRFVNDEELLYSLGVVLRKALAHTIGVNTEEIDFGVRKEQNYLSLYIYDTMKGGCGYSTQMLDPHTCNTVFNEARRMFSTFSCNCESNTTGACVHCLVDLSSQRYERKLSKYKVMSWFAGQKMLLAPSTIGDPAIPMTLKHLVTHEICNATVRRLTFCVDASEMNVNDWISQDGIMGSLLHECVKRGKQVAIKVSNVPSVRNGSTLAEITPFVDLPSKMHAFNVEAIESLETQTGVYSALIVDGVQCSHYYVEQSGVLPFSETWGDDCTALFSNQTIPQLIPSTFPTLEDVANLNRPTNYVRTGDVQDITTTIGRFYNDVILNRVLQPNDDNDIRAILGGKRVNITFSDSYVNSALASLMLTYLIKSTRDLYNFEICRIDLQFQATNRNCNNPRWNDYTYINLSFPDADDADDYTREQFEDVLDVTPNFLSGIPDHYRWLRFQPEGEDLYVEIRPDYGISGGWQSNRKYIDRDILDGRTPVKTKDNISVAYYIFVKRE